MLKIDCHTHIVNKSIRDEYFKKTDGYAIVLEFLPRFQNDEIKDESWELVKDDERLFLSPVIDIAEPIPKQLERIEPYLDEYKIVGLKIFLSYEKGRADEEKMMCIYDFARKHNLTITYHTGLCSLVLPSDQDIDGSDARYIENVAKKYKDVNFVVAHMDDPRYDECMRILHENPNVFSDFSGAYEPGTHVGEDVQGAIKEFSKAIHKYEDTWRQMLYGTDFCPPINLTAVAEYDVTIAGIFKEEQFNAIYSENCLRAFPRIKKFLPNY